MDLIKHGVRREGGEGKGGKVSVCQAEFPLQQPLLLSLGELLQWCNPTRAWATSTAASPASAAAHRGWRNRAFNHFDLPMFLSPLFCWFPWQPARCGVTAMVLQTQPRHRRWRTRQHSPEPQAWHTSHPNPCSSSTLRPRHPASCC